MGSGSCRAIQRCTGTGDVLDHLPPGVTYVGLDADSGYIKTAIERHGYRGTFHCVELGQQPAPPLGRFDRVLADGVLHHLDSSTATELLALAAEVLLPEGHLVTIDPYFADGQGWISKRLISADRGKHVRRVPAYVELVRRYFADVDSMLRADLLRLPYDLLMLQCRNPFNAEKVRDEDRSPVTT